MNTPQNTTFWETRSKTDSHKDWHYPEGGWIEGYEKSVEHPHRVRTMELLKTLAPFESLLEIGCSVGPNLKLIREKFPKVTVAGVDPNEASVEASHVFVGGGVIVGDVRNLLNLFPMKGFDVILADASLMYVEPEEIASVMDAIALVAKKAVVIVERCTDSKKGTIAGGVWGRDYEFLLKERGFKVTKERITEAQWPGSPNWAKYGYYLVGKK